MTFCGTLLKEAAQQVLRWEFVMWVLKYTCKILLFKYFFFYRSYMFMHVYVIIYACIDIRNELNPENENGCALRNSLALEVLLMKMRLFIDSI